MSLRLGVLIVLLYGSAYAEQIGPYTIGEKLNYSIQWGVFHVGDSTFQTSLIQNGGDEDEICVEFASTSRGLADVMYEVNSETRVYINPITLKTKRVERKVDEGEFLAESTLRFDYNAMRARWENHTTQEVHEYELPPETTDFYSLLYRLRDGLETGQSPQTVRVAVDDKIHDLKIIISGEDAVRTPEGEKLCTRLRVEPLTAGLFVRKIPEEVWISKGTPNRLERMRVKVPLGTVQVNYRPGK